ncbi:MAG: UDP-N-acetylglucosamine--N-acetylmuramyl-(pentapeptide) pyrophosphoryl-undecaprenol N-acetylglucosamine transferase [Dehalococcoidia bacterium]|nr:UDP-N-acetylglucosamine--N-acetylmuramyl-(pentapeptide) pyrophosphoryl-undecaprenol N-acetylglucosamine transferase [Dehalococcoidia bacterium]
MKFALAGGGTGGHAYPAIAVAERLRAVAGTELVYYGTERGPERAVAERANIPYRAVPASPVRSRSPIRLATGLVQLWRGARVAARLLAEDRPAAVFATGGYAAAPVGRAAQRAGIPLAVFLPDVHPGWAVRFLARHATTVACSVDRSLPLLPTGRAVVTGYPVRSQFLDATREEGIAHFGLDPALKTLLVVGGSLGAHQINLAVAGALRTLLEQAQIIHISGVDEEHWLQRERERLPEWLRSRYHLHAYTEEMAFAMRAADLAVTRAGASTLGELPISGLPAIVIPGAFSDQQINADYLAREGAAVTLPTIRLDELESLIVGLFDDRARRQSMAIAMRRLARPDAAGRLADLLREVAA